MILIRDYQLGPRIAYVSNSCEESQANYPEVMYLAGETIRFQSDGAHMSVTPENRGSISKLNNGDIITINERGFVYKLYESDYLDATVFMTGQCNSNCIMCPESDHERRFNGGLGEEWTLDFIEMLPDKLEQIVVTGGEPTLHPEFFFRVMNRINERFPCAEILLLSNGRSFAARKMVNALFTNCPGNMTVAIPIHGNSERLHDGITRAPGSFHQSLQGIRKLLAKDVQVEIRIVVSKLNFHALSDTAAMIADQFPGVRIVNFIGLETMGNCVKNLSQVYIDYADAFPFVRDAAKKLIQAGIDVSLYNFPLCTVDSGFWPLCRNSITPYKIRFAPACEECEVKSYCGGVFRSTLAVAKPKLTPIHIV